MISVAAIVSLVRWIDLDPQPLEPCGQTSTKSCLCRERGC
jgi:hypothetical protein